MAVPSANPVLSRLDETARTGRRVLGADAPVMTVREVTTRTLGLLLLAGLVAALAWKELALGDRTWVAALGAGLATLVLGLVISFRRITHPLPIAGYAALQGVLLGLASRAFNEVYPGIVLQAVLGTFGVFCGMAVLYRFRVLRATPRFTRLVLGALLGVVVLSLGNLLIYLFTGRQGLEVYGTGGEVGWLPYVFALVCITVGALTFIVDFDAVQRGVRDGLPRRYAWYCAFGLLAGLIFLYWQILRLIGYLRR
jgi:uncharacterized YccA/Bax inhibitor family protein